MFERISVKKINEHIYLLNDNNEATGYLVIGSEKALVVDTMKGFENVKAVVRTITDLPLMVVNTHGHYDHIYGNIYFDKAYMHPADLEIAAARIAEREFQERITAAGLTMPPFEPIREGDEIDLGGLHLEVYELPGHTPGSILLLLKEDRILFVGDAIIHYLWMQLPESLSVAEYAVNLERVMFLKEYADRILHGHAQDIEGTELMDKLLKGAREVAAGQTDDDQPYVWYRGVDKQHKIDTNGDAICYK